MAIHVTPIPRLTVLTTPAFTLGTANAAGDAISSVASNSTLLAFDTTVPAANSLSVTSSATGSAVVASRRDHVHGTPVFDETLPVANSFSVASSVAGTATVASHRDHVHGTPAPAQIATGTYSGDGSTSQAITGVGFTVKWLMVAFRNASEAAGASVGWLITTDTIMDDNASGMALRWSGDTESYQYRIDAIIALGTDGFTVDDDGSDRHPNKDGSTYNYTALG